MKTIAFATVLGVLVVGLGLVMLSNRQPQLGPVDSRLRRCPESPNCVCSFDEDDEHHIAPFDVLGDPQETSTRLRGILESLPRVRIVVDEGPYLHAEFTTPLLRFVDDVEFLLDETAGVIHVRSASRVGRADFGVNRRRVEMLRRMLTGDGT